MGTDVSFAFSNLVPGAYRFCIQVLAGGYLFVIFEFDQEAYSNSTAFTQLPYTDDAALSRLPEHTSKRNPDRTERTRSAIPRDKTKLDRLGLDRFNR
jgi:hypothetical protein